MIDKLRLVACKHKIHDDKAQLIAASRAGGKELVRLFGEDRRWPIVCVVIFCYTAAIASTAIILSSRQEVTRRQSLSPMASI